jgi:hypothetical protein
MQAERAPGRYQLWRWQLHYFAADFRLSDLIKTLLRASDPIDRVGISIEQ